MTKFRCTNCLWEGTTEDMSHDNGFYSCPECCAEFYPDENTVGPWEIVVDDDPEDEDYGDF